MKVLVVSDSALPRIDGISIAVQQQLDSLASEGVTTHFIAPAAAGAGTSSGKDTQSAVTRLRAQFKIGDGYPIVLGATARTRRHIRTFSPSEVRVHTLGPLGLSSLTQARQLGIQVVLYWHTDLVDYARFYPTAALAWLALSANILRRGRSPAIPNSRRSLECVIGQLLRMCDVIVVPTEKALTQVTVRLGYQGRTIVKPTQVNLPVPSAGRRPVAGRAPHILYIGRVAREKNLDLLFRAFEIAHEMDPTLHLTIAGPTTESQAKRLLHRWSSILAPCLTVTGPLNRQEVSDLLETGSVLVVPALNETQSLTLDEALYAGLAVVVVDGELTRGRECPLLHLAEAEPMDLAQSIVRVSKPL